MSYQLLQGDALEQLKRLPSNSVDLVILDPPYPDLEKYRAVGTTTRLKKNWYNIITYDYLDEVLKEVDRVLKKNRHVYIWANYESLFNIHELAKKRWRYANILIWDKDRMGMGYHYRHQAEYVLFYEKGDRKLNRLNVSNIFREKIRDKQHPSQKPLGMTKTLIELSTKEGEVVLDPFMGSGVSGVAAIQLGRHFIGIEKDPKYFNEAEERIKKTLENKAKREKTRQLTLIGFYTDEKGRVRPITKSIMKTNHILNGRRLL